AEGFLLECELLAFAPRRGVLQPKGVIGRRRSAPRLAVVEERAKQLRLPFVAIALQARAVLARRIDCRHQARAERRRRQRLVRRAAGERIAGARFDQALEHTLVEEPQVEILAQRVQRRDRPLLLPDGEQRFDGAFADVLDRRQPEAYGAVWFD